MSIRRGFTRLRTHSLRRGFTLTEILLSITIIIVLAAAVFAALDPVRRLNGARNTRRMTEVTAIVDALKAYQADHDGTLCVTPGPGCIDFVDALYDDSVQIIGEDIDCTNNIECAGQNVPTGASANCAVELTVNGQTVRSDGDHPTIPALKAYLPKIPYDPLIEDAGAGADNSRYYINYDNLTGTITVGACDAEPEGSRGSGLPKAIELSR